MRGQNNQRQFVVDRCFGIFVIGRFQHGIQFALDDWDFWLFVGCVMGTGDNELQIQYNQWINE